MQDFKKFLSSSLNNSSFCSILNLLNERKPKMATKKRIKTDIVVKNYWRDNIRFADFFNAVLFEGRQVIRPEDLEDLDTEGSFILEHKNLFEGIQAARDNIKICKRSIKHSVAFVMLGNEAQEHIHYAMPLRIMGYDYGTYKKQYDERARKYRNDPEIKRTLEDDELLSGMKRTDRLIPVITLVVYYGERPWDGATSLHELLTVDEELAPFVNDYKMLLVEAKKNDQKLHNVENIDLFNLLSIFLNEEKRMEKVNEYVREHEVAGEVLMTVAGVTGRKSICDVSGKKGEDAMCTIWEEIEKKGREEGLAEGHTKGLAEGHTRGLAEGHTQGLAEGHAQGLLEGHTQGLLEGQARGIIDMGLEYGLSKNDILKQLQKKLKISAQEAKEYFEQFAEQLV